MRRIVQTIVLCVLFPISAAVLSAQSGTSARPSVWEGGIRVPTIVRWPGRFAAGLVTDQVGVTMEARELRALLPAWERDVEAEAKGGKL